jgi:hypothetical protein
MLTSKKLVGADPCSFWRDLVFLNIQARGASQSDMLALLDPRLRKLCGIGWKDCGSKKPKTFAYIDDVLCTGNHIRRDLEKWIETDAPAAATLHVITIALHTAGRFFIADKIAKAAQKVSKKIQILWWRHRELETTTGKRDNSDVLWPTELPDDKAVAQYVSGMNHKPLFLSRESLGRSVSSPAKRGGICWNNNSSLPAFGFERCVAISEIASAHWVT